MHTIVFGMVEKAALFDFEYLDGLARKTGNFIFIVTPKMEAKRECPALQSLFELIPFCISQQMNEINIFYCKLMQITVN